MAQSKSKKVAKRYKPEEVIRARPKARAIPPKPVKKPKPPKKPKRKHSLKKYTSRRVKQPIFMLIVASVLSIAIIIVWLAVSRSITATNATLKESVGVTSGMFAAAKTEADLVKIIGTTTQRTSEVKNFQSAPKDLQTFVTSDYRQFKKQCIANGTLSQDVGYEVSNVIYDSFAVVKRTCNGTDTAILKKFDTKWAVVASGNVLPSCSLVNDLAIPQGASYYCTQDGTTFVNANP